MKKIINYISATILLLGTMVSIWYLLNNLQPLKPALYSFAMLILIGIGVCLKLFAPNFLKRSTNTLVNITRYKHFSVMAISVIALFGILVRLYFYIRFSYTPVSDPVTFYDAAKKIADGHGIIGDTYVAFFPYLAAYDTLLGLAMKVISSPWLATILLNTALDIGAAAIIYFLIKKMTKPDSSLPMIAFGVWLLNPFNILFSVMSLPVVVVNFFVIATIFLVFLLTESIAKLKMVPSLAFASLLGITMGLGNCFRPIFIIAVLALFLLFLYIFLTRKRTKRLLLLLGVPFLLIVVIFFGTQKLNLSFVTKETGISAASNAFGWSVYVGSNWESDGTWNESDEHNAKIICPESINNEDCHEKLLEAGIDRYKSYGADGTSSLLVRKMYVFSGYQSSVYNAHQSLDSYSDSNIAKLLNIYIVIFITVLFALSARFLYLSAERVLSKKESMPIIFFTAVLMLGFFLSAAFVETSQRYAQIMYPIFTIFAVLSLDTSKNRSLKRTD